MTFFAIEMYSSDAGKVTHENYLWFTKLVYSNNPIAHPLRKNFVLAT